MTRQQLREILPARSKCVWEDNTWDEYLKEQIISMIFPEQLQPKKYQLIAPKNFNFNGHDFNSTLKIKNEFGWFYVETLEDSNGNNILDNSIQYNGNSVTTNLERCQKEGYEINGNNGNSLLHDRDNSGSNLLCEHEKILPEKKESEIDNDNSNSLCSRIRDRVHNSDNSEMVDREEGAVKKPDAGTMQPIQYNPSLINQIPASGNLNLPDTMIEQFLASIDVSAQSKVNYAYGLRKLQEYSKTHSNWYTPQGLIEFKRYLYDSGLDTSTINTHLIASRRMFKHLFKRGLIPIDPTDELKNYRPKKSRREAFSKEDVIKLLDTIKTSNKPMNRSQDAHKNILIRDYTMTRLIVKTGLREISVENAMLKDIGFKDGKYILWVLVKGHADKDEYVVLTDNLMDDLNKCNAYPGQEYIFVGHGNKNRNQQLTRRHIRKIITRYMIQAGIKTEANCVHALRNFFIQETIKNGADLTQTQLSVHHTDPKTTMGYAGDLDRINNPAESFITGI